MADQEQRPPDPDELGKTISQRMTGQPGGDADLQQEVVIWTGRYSMWAMGAKMVLLAIVTLAAAIGLTVLSSLGILAGSVGGMAVVAVAWIAFGAVALLAWLWLLSVLAVRKLDHWYELTTQRFVHKHGIIRRATDRIEVIKIDDVRYYQDLIERIFGVGTIVIISTDNTDPELKLRGIADVEVVSNKLDDVRRKQRRLRGVQLLD